VRDALIESLPKVELHVHLEGTISARTATSLAQAHGEDPVSTLVLVDGDYPHPFDDFDHFLRTFLATSAMVRTPEDLTTITAAFLANQAQQQVRWCEPTFTAVTMVRRGWADDRMWAALAEGIARVPEVGAGLILDTPRDLGVPAATQNIVLAERALAAGLPIVALGLTGIEGSVEEREFHLLREAADRLGLGFVAHAGESGGPERVMAALDELRSDRIGHGIAVASDPALMARLAADGTVLEVCPSSNVALGLVSSLATHPLLTLHAAGVAVTINSDDPPFFATTLTDELRHAGALLDLDAAGHALLQRRAIDASFAPRAIWQQVHAELDAWLSAAR
jgi:adenosine deaminase